MALVSVLVTAFNRESCLAGCIDSVLNSTFEDFELIIVDDCSEDRSCDIALKLAKQDDRIRFYANETNLGDYPNRNQAASYATGKYIKYLDSDDMIYPHGLGVMVSAMERYPEAALGLSLNTIEASQPYPFMTSSRNVIKTHLMGKSILSSGPSGAILRHDVFRNVGGFSGQQFVGDIELWLEIAEKWPVVSFQPALIWWRRHEQQQMTLERANPEVLSIRYKLGLQTLNSTLHLDTHDRTRVERRMKQHHARQILSILFKQKRPNLAWQLFRNAGLTLSELLRGFAPYQNLL